MSRSLCLVFQPDLLQQKLTVQHNLIKKKLQDSQALIKPPTTAAVREGVQNRGLNCLVSRSTHVPGVPGACFSHRIVFFSSVHLTSLKALLPQKQAAPGGFAVGNKL